MNQQPFAPSKQTSLEQATNYQGVLNPFEYFRRSRVYRLSSIENTIFNYNFWNWSTHGSVVGLMYASVFWLEGLVEKRYVLSQRSLIQQEGSSLFTGRYSGWMLYDKAASISWKAALVAGISSTFYTSYKIHSRQSDDEILSLYNHISSVQQDFTHFQNNIQSGCSLGFVSGLILGLLRWDSAPLVLHQAPPSFFRKIIRFSGDGLRGLIISVPFSIIFNYLHSFFINHFKDPS